MAQGFPLELLAVAGSRLRARRSWAGVPGGPGKCHGTKEQNCTGFGNKKATAGPYTETHFQGPEEIETLVGGEFLREGFAN